MTQKAWNGIQYSWETFTNTDGSVSIHIVDGNGQKVPNGDLGLIKDQGLQLKVIDPNVAAKIGLALDADGKVKII